MSGHVRDDRPRARKPHRCYLCGEFVEVGDTYVRRLWSDGGKLSTTKMHVECEAETANWEDWDWEEFFPGDMPRPTDAREETS